MDPRPAARSARKPAPRLRKLAPRGAPPNPAPPPPPPGALTCAVCGRPRSPTVTFSPPRAPQLRLCSPHCCAEVEGALEALGRAGEPA